MPVHESHIFSNDSVSEALESLCHLRFEGSKSENFAAILVGTGNVITYLPILLRLGVKKIYVLDVDEFVLNWLNKLLETYLNAESSKHFKDRLFSLDNKLFAELIESYRIEYPSITVQDVRKRLEVKLEEERDEAYPFHYCSNVKKFLELKDVLNSNKEKINILRCNLFEKQETTSFISHLNENNERIVFANFTNVGDWSKRENLITIFTKFLNDLPWHHQAVIQSTTGAMFKATIEDYQKYIDRMSSSPESSLRLDKSS